MRSFKLLKLMIILCLLVMMSFTGCDFFGNDGGSKTYAIGDTGPGGGLVFYISDGGKHGMEVSSSDLNLKVPWITGGSTSTNAVPGGTKKEIGTGLANTDAIIAQAKMAGNNDMASYAAGIARSYNGGGKTDWHLPSIDELNAVWDNLVDDGMGLNSGIGNFTNDYYYSSTEEDFESAIIVYFYIYSGHSYIGYKNSLRKVRAVRAF